jgi:hypothetical protein
MTVTGQIDGVPLTLRFGFGFSEMEGYWVMSIDDQDGNPLLASVPVLTGDQGAANLLEQHGYLGIGSLFCINASGVGQDLPGVSNLGRDFFILWDDSAV